MSNSPALHSRWLMLQKIEIGGIYFLNETSACVSDTILKGDHPRTIPAKFALIWFSGFRGKDLNVIFYQNMPNLYFSQFIPFRNIMR
jgi:hypothetical protein